MSSYPYIHAQHGFYCDAGGFPYLSLMPDFITLIENLPKIDRYHTSSIGNINTAQSLAISTIKEYCEGHVFRYYYHA